MSRRPPGRNRQPDPAIRRRATRRGPAGWIAAHWRPLVGVLLAVVLIGVAYVVYTLRSLPDMTHETLLGQTIVVYDVKGRVIEQRNPKGQFYVVLKLDEMGKNGPDAMLAAEDRQFYNEGALNLGSTFRALLTDISCRCYSQGGSTITQQLVKIELLTPQKSIFRKVQEAILAEAVSRQFSKQQILELYLNRVYYGHGAYGIGAATKTYFGKDKQVKDLTPAQAAFLAGLVQAPYYYDPQTHFERARARQLYVLGGMVATGAITQDEADKAEQENIQKELKFDTSYRVSKAPHFVDYVLGKVEQQVGAATIQQGGFAVYTTLDLDLQALAARSVKDGVGQLQWGNVNNGDLLAADPRTGAILAWVGSTDYYNVKIGGQFDVVLSPRQPGSSFKPYVYEAALKDHTITLADILQDTPHTFGDYKPHDFDDRFEGPMSARKALVESRNVPAVLTGQKEGMDKVNALAHQMGIRTPLNDELATAIGSSDVTMFDHLQGYQVFANQGKKVPLVSITKIVDREGNTLFEQKPGDQPDQQQVLSPAEAYLITSVLKNYQTQWELGWDRQMASKSGTTGGAETGVHRDAWMMAYNPRIVVGAWGGNTQANGAGQSISAFGVNVGSTALADFINGMPDSRTAWYDRPDGLVDGKGCPGQDDAKNELFLPGTHPNCEGAPKPTPSPTSAPTPSPLPVPSPSPIPSIGPPSPPGGGGKPSPSPQPSPTI